MNVENGSDREQSIPPQTSDEQSRSFRLRAEQPRVTRLSRKVLGGGSAVALLVIAGAVLWSLQGNRSRKQAADELYSTDHHNIADGITALPKDYTGVPPKPSRSLARHFPETLVGRSLLRSASRP